MKAQQKIIEEIKEQPKIIKDFEKFFDAIDKAKKHLNWAELNQSQLGHAISHMIDGAHRAAGFPYYRRALGLLKGGHDRHVIESKIERVAIMKCGMRKPVYRIKKSHEQKTITYEAS